MECAALADFGGMMARAWRGALKAMHSRGRGDGTLPPEIVAEPAVSTLAEATASVLDAAVSRAPLSETMRRALSRCNRVFSGIKAFHALNEAFPSMVDADGNLKPFEHFLNDVRTVDKTYNSRYLRAEYSMAVSAAQSAADWERFQDPRFDLQYRTAGDSRVRPEHAALNGVTLPPSSPFWDSFMPPNGWGCRCHVVQVRRGKYPHTDVAEALERGEEATVRDKRRMFRFNPGKEGRTFPAYNPYTIPACRQCPEAGGDTTLAKAAIPDNTLCAVCRIVREMTIANTKQTRKKAKFLQGTELHHKDFAKPIAITGASIKEWTNQPHKHPFEKNRLLLNIQKEFETSSYLGRAGNHKQKEGVIDSHIFEINISGDTSYIIVLEYEWGDVKLHSITDNIDKIRKYLNDK